MKDRLITFALAIGAFVLFYALFAPKPVRQDETVALPTSIETKPDGYQALWRWLQAEHIPVVSFREHYDRLARRAPSDTGNLLIVTVPQQTPSHADELEALDEWVADGNTLLVLAALDDTPRWALSADGDVSVILKRMTRMKFFVKEPPAATQATDKTNQAQDEDIDTEDDESETQDEEDTSETLQEAFKRLLQPERSRIEPIGQHPLFSGVKGVAAFSDFPASRWHAKPMDTAALLALARRADANLMDKVEPKVWLKRQGTGQIIVCAFASPFNNRMLGELDNARLFANIVDWSRGVDTEIFKPNPEASLEGKSPI